MTANIANSLNDLPEALTALLPFGGDVGRFRAAQMRSAEMRGLTPLWKNSQEMIDDAVIRIGREGLVIAADLMDKHPVALPGWLGILEVTSHKIGEARMAQRGMIPGAKGDGGLTPKTPFTLPVYVTWDTFEFNARELAAAERSGHPLDTIEVEQAFRNINMAIEDATINGLDVTVAGRSVPGLLDTTNTQAYASAEAWDAAGKTGPEILTDVLAMAGVLAADKYYGPYTLYIPTTYGITLNRPFEATGITSLSIRAYLEMLTFGNGKLTVKVADLLPTNRTIMIQDNSNTADVIIGQTPVAINPKPELEFHTKWYVYAVVVPRVKSDYNSNFGLVAGNTT